MHLHALRPRTGCPFHAASLLRASARRSDRRWCLRASRSYCWQACGTRIFRPSACGGLATSIALFMRGGEGYPHDLLLANSLGVYFNAIAQRLCIGMFLAPSTSNDLVRHGICSIFGFANRAPFKFQLTVFRKPLVGVGWCLHHES